MAQWGAVNDQGPTPGAVIPTSHFGREEVGVHRIAVLLGIGSGLWLSGCTSLAPEQPRTLMRQVAQACASQVPDVAVLEVTSFGRLIYGYGKRGQGYRDAFLACYQAGVNQEIHARVAPGHLPSAAGVGARTTVPLTRRGDTLLVPVTLNRTAQVSLVVEAGTSHTPLHPGVLARIGLAVPSDARRWTVTLPGRPPLSTPLVRVASLAIGALAVEDLDVGLSEAVSGVPGSEGVLGADVLGYCRLTVDRAAQQLTLEVIHATAPPRRTRWKASSMSAQASERGARHLAAQLGGTGPHTCSV